MAEPRIDPEMLNIYQDHHGKNKISLRETIELLIKAESINGKESLLELLYQKHYSSDDNG